MKPAIDCKRTMIAIAAVEHAGVQYAPGDAFTVDSERAYQYHLKCNSAKDDDSTGAAPTDKDPVQPTPKEKNGTTIKRPVRRS